MEVARGRHQDTQQQKPMSQRGCRGRQSLLGHSGMELVGVKVGEGGEGSEWAVRTPF